MRWPVAGLGLLLAASACSGSAAGDPALPPPGARWDYQIGGAAPPGEGVGVVVRDRGDDPEPGVYSLCYVNAFQSQPGADVPDELLLRDAAGLPVEDPDWPGEYLFDVSTAERRDALLDHVGPWLDRCAEDGFDAVEADNLDSWTRSRGLLGEADAAATARLLVDRAHAAGLAIAQKNAAELAGADLGFDLAVTEDCAVHDECATYAAAFGVVLDVEYTDEGFAAACAAGVEGVSVVRRDLAVATPDDPGYVAEWCPAR
ncbi:endo alpha-1,4 polygalactosaminidase [Blastococcus sp. TF02A-26]|uniref:endo alpha-1,4 polygalactosaminidase n=1 Tax=Blastococcus sp. TF02A-26 TaxID=2250577 RepID=UPI001F356F6D|nr:endo alpha-1,4 polygalactosaminidase [Blastococcus sp. TF02A-26]